MKESNNMTKYYLVGTLEQPCLLRYDDKTTLPNNLQDNVVFMDEDDVNQIHRSLDEVDEDESELMKELEKISKEEYDSDTDADKNYTYERIEDERIYQEDRAVDQLINKQRGK